MVRVNMINPLPSGTPMYEQNRWQDRASCGGKAVPEPDRDQFTASYPTAEVGRDLARRYCHQCPVMRECRLWADEEPCFSGVAGGALFVGAKHSGHPRRIIPILRRTEVGNING